MIRKMITIFCVLSLLAVFPGGVSRAATPAIDQPPLPDSASLSIPYGPGVLSIPVSAFVPELPEFNYENHGRYLKFFGPNISYPVFNAAVHLPHGATITGIGFTFYDDSTTKNATARLEYKELNEALPVTLAAYTTPGSAGWYQGSQPVAAVVDNYSYAYWVEMELPISSETAGNRVWGGGLHIHYTLPAVETGILSIPGSTFKPSQDGYNFNAKDGGIISLPGGNYLAQVQLPQGAVVTRLAILYHDNESDHTITVRLRRSDAGYSDMASVSSLDSAYDNRNSTTAITDATIDNAVYTYCAYLEFPDIHSAENVFLYGVEIEYDLPSGNPEHVISLSTAAFTGFFDGFDYDNHTRWLFHLAGEGGSTDPQVYLAPVYLPNGSIVSRVQFGFYDGSTTKNSSAYLIATRLGTNYAMASTTTASSAGYLLQAVSGDDIEYAKIDNSEYAYFVYYVLPPSGGVPLGSDDVVATKVRIYYRPPAYAYLPLTMK